MKPLLMMLFAPGLLAAETPADCDTLYQAHLASDMTLTYQEFDQTPGQGFRELAGAGCPARAADLIEAYIEHNDATQGSLMWHIAQLRATAGQTDAAIVAANRSLRDDDTGEFQWNEYVLATIAFLEKDREALEKHRDALAAKADAHPGNAINLKLVDALVRHFEHDYAYATSRIE